MKHCRLQTYVLALCFMAFGHITHGKKKITTPENPTWEEVTKNYEFPTWFTEARFGIWLHWGAQTQPSKGGGWYARHMYQEDVGREKWGKNAYAYHNKTYGHPSEVGFKDVANAWKAENLDANKLTKYFKSIGAKYLMVLSSHHDHFDNFASTYHPWNSVNVGPHRDIIGEFNKAAKRYHIPYCVSSHDDRYKRWWLPAFGSDKSGPKKGVHYDGYMTKEDGIGKWWEGLDPADLYGVPPEKRTPAWHKKVDQNWLDRHTELVTKYDVDMLWFDGHEFPYDSYGKELCRRFYYNSMKKSGKVNVVVAGKFRNEPATVKDVERGGTNEILRVPWQGTLTFGSWFYKEDKEIRHNTRTVIENMADIISKNGNLLLNVELYPDGTIPPSHKLILDEVGQWIHTNKEAIYASKPWSVYGDNLGSTRMVSKDGGQIGEVNLADLKKNKKKEHFNARTKSSPAYGNDEVRFTTKGDHLYMFVLNPAEGDIEIPSLGFASLKDKEAIRSIKMLGGHKVQFKQKQDKLVLSVPNKRPNNYCAVFRIDGLL
ncbi:alpha-L-fucosidase [Halosquirtibacter xylanolyticus]|uniref:alpha-L-fucosidase n=1 Tax=Halosquirtibacter xylanolyticus TaxID=3374599 RepID=UPI0037482347|nr:alpha-L-fucosidase [Prolixibacteraceae bacterium]